MKSLLLLISIFCLSQITAKAQLQNTKWRGIANMAVPTDVLLVFDKDSTAEAFMMPDSVSLAVMIFKVTGDTVSLRKISGTIPCDDTTTGTFKFEIINDKLNMHVIADDCMARAHSLDGTTYDRVK